MSKQSGQTIPDARDARNRRLLSHIAYSPMARFLRLDAERLVIEGTPEEREAYAKRVMKWALLISVILAVYLLSIDWQKVGQQQPSSKVLSEVDAGKIQSVQLHETSFSRSTTIVTTVGTYQVVGGVSAEAGVYTTLKREQALSGGVITSVCVESHIKQACYPLL